MQERPSVMDQQSGFSSEVTSDVVVSTAGVLSNGLAVQMM